MENKDGRGSDGKLKIPGVPDKYDGQFVVFYGADRTFAIKKRKELLKLLEDSRIGFVKYKPEGITEGSFVHKPNSNEGEK